MSISPAYFTIDDFAFPSIGVAAGSDSTSHSPADVLRWALVDLAVLSAPNIGDWPGFADYEPSTPDECVTLYDTQGNDDGRSMNDGALYSHHGIQVRIRSKTAPVGWDKAEQVRIALAQSIKLMPVSVDSEQYLIQAVTRIGQVLPIGRETPTTKGRFVFTINTTISLRKLS